jgi:hypothetical protein
MDLKRHTQFTTCLSAVLRPEVGLRRQSMVNMNGRKRENCGFPQTGKQVHQNAGIKAAGIADTQSGAGLNVPLEAA